MKFYGLLDNRLAEGKTYCDKIEKGTDITMYYYSDRECFYVTDVISDKEIKVKRYYVCADFSKPGGIGHQNWMYFKTAEEMHKYLIKLGRASKNEGIASTSSRNAETWVFRYKKWMQKVEFKDHISGKIVVEYYNLPGKISFGVRDYHYDWEF